MNTTLNAILVWLVGNYIWLLCCGIPALLATLIIASVSGSDD